MNQSRREIERRKAIRERYPIVTVEEAMEYARRTAHWVREALEQALERDVARGGEGRGTDA